MWGYSSASQENLDELLTSSSTFASVRAPLASPTPSSNCFQVLGLNEPKIPHKNDFSGSWLSSRSGKYSSRSGHCLTNSQTGVLSTLYIWALVSWSLLCASGSKSRVVSEVYNNSYLLLLCKNVFEEIDRTAFVWRQI